MLNVAQQGRYIKVVTNEDIDDFARITGDNQRLHLDEEFAKNNRYGRRIAHGMLTGGFVSACLGTVLPGEGTVLMEQSFKFLEPVFVDQQPLQIGLGDGIESKLLAARYDGWEEILRLVGDQHQNSPFRRLLKNFKQGIAGGRIHVLGVMQDHDTSFCLVWLHGKRAA